MYYIYIEKKKGGHTLLTYINLLNLYIYVYIYVSAQMYMKIQMHMAGISAEYHAGNPENCGVGPAL